MDCQMCQSPMEFRQGVNKAGKPYAGNFCTNQNCKNVVWVNTQTSPQPAQTAPQSAPQAQRVAQPTPRPATSKDEMILSYAKDICIKNAELNSQPVDTDDVWVIYKKLLAMRDGTYKLLPVNTAPNETVGDNVPF